MGRHAARAGQLGQPLAVRAVLAADDQHHVGLGGELPNRLLAILRGIADVVPRRTDDLRKSPPQSLDDLGRIVDRQRRLGQIRHLRRVGHFERVDVRRLLDQPDRLGRFAHRSDHLIVPGVADQQDRVSLLGKADGFQVDLGHQRASHVDRLQTPRGRLLPNLRRHAVGRVEQMFALGHVRQIVDEDDPLPPEPIDHPFVVDDLVVDVQRRAVGADGQFQGLDRHVHARTKPTWPGQNDPHGSLTR